MEASLPYNSSSTSARGRKGEDQACAIVSACGCKVIQRNFRTARGEVDIIAMEQSSLCFIEVKCWKRELWPDLTQSLDRRKRMRLRDTALAWLANVPVKTDYRSLRFDLIVIDPLSGDHEWLRGALDL